MSNTLNDKPEGSGLSSMGSIGYFRNGHGIQVEMVDLNMTQLAREVGQIQRAATHLQQRMI